MEEVSLLSDKFRFGTFFGSWKLSAESEDRCLSGIPHFVLSPPCAWDCRLGGGAILTGADGLKTLPWRGIQASQDAASGLELPRLAVHTKILIDRVGFGDFDGVGVGGMMVFLLQFRTTAFVFLSHSTFHLLIIDHQDCLRMILLLRVYNCFANSCMMMSTGNCTKPPPPWRLHSYIYMAFYGHKKGGKSHSHPIMLSKSTFSSIRISLINIDFLPHNIIILILYSLHTHS